MLFNHVLNRIFSIAESMISYKDFPSKCSVELFTNWKQFIFSNLDDEKNISKCKMIFM